MAQGGKYSLSIQAYLDEGKIQEQLKVISQKQKIKIDVDGSKTITEIKKIEDALGNIVTVTQKGGVVIGTTLTNNIAKSEKEVEKLKQKLQLSSEQLDKMKVNSQAVFKEYNRGGNEAVLQTQRLEAEMKDISAEMQKQISLGDQLDKSTVSSLQKRQQLANAQLQTMKSVNSAQAKNISSMSTVTSNAEKLMSTFGKVAMFGGITAAIGTITQISRQAIEEIFELNGAITEFTKVSDLSGASLDAYTDKMFKLGKEVGRTGSELYEASTLFKKSGFDEGEAAKLGQIASVYQNIADSQLSAGESSEFLISQMKAFDITAENSIHIIDAVNEVSNKFATSTSEIGKSLPIVASTMAQAGNSFEQTIGIFTSASELMPGQGGKIARAMRSLSMNLQGLDDAGEEVLDLLPKMEEDFNKIGITLQNTDGSMKSSFQILSEMSEAYKTLDKDTQNYYSGMVAGKNNIDVMNAIMKNFETAIKATETAMNSSGSAMKENERYMESFAARVSQLKSSFQEWAIQGTGVVSMALDLANGLMNIENATGLLTPAIIGLGVALGFASGGLGFVIGGIVALFTGLPKLFDAVTVTAGEQAEKVSKLSDNLKGLQSEYDALSSKRGKTENEELRLKILESEIKLQEEELANNEKLLAQKELLGKGIAFDQGAIGRAGAAQGDLDAQMGRYAELQKIIKETEDTESSRFKNAVIEMKEYEKSMVQLAKTTQEENDILLASVEALEGKEKERVMNQILANEQTLKNADALGFLAQATTNAGTSQQELSDETDRTNLSLADQKKLIESLQETYSDSAKSVDTLNSIVQDLNKNHTLSSDSISEIVSKYPDLIGLIGNEEAMRQALIDKIQEEVKVQEDALFAMIENDENYYNQKILMDAETKNQLESLFNQYFNNLGSGYQVDLANYSNMEDAKVQITAQLINELNAMWSTYFGSLATSIEGITAQTKKEDITPEQWEQMSGLEKKQYQNIRDKETELKKGLGSVSNLAKGIADNFKAATVSSQGLAKGLDLVGNSGKESGSGVDKAAKEAEKAKDRFDKFKESVLDLNKALNQLNRDSIDLVKNLEQLEFGDFSVFDADKDKTLEELRPLIEAHKKEIAKLYSDLEKLKNVNTGKLTEEEDKALKKQIELLKENIKEQESIQKDYAKNLENIRKQMEKDYEDGIKKEVEARYKAEKDKLEAEKKALKDRQDLIKQQLDDLKSLQDMTVDLIKQEKNDEIKALDERKKAVEDLADAKRKALKEEQDARNYAKELKNKEKAVSDIEKRIAELQFDTSAKGTKERLELEEQLAKAKEDLEDLQYEESIKKQEDAIDEQEKKEKDSLDKQIQMIKDYLSKEGQIRDDANKLIQSNSKELYDKLSQYNKDYVGMTQKELDTMFDSAMSGMSQFSGSINSVNDAFDNMASSIKDIVKELEKLSEIDIDKDLIEEDVRDEHPPAGGGDKTESKEEIKDTIRQMMDNSKSWNSADDKEKDRLAKENERLAKKIGAWKSSKDGAWYVMINDKAYQINNGDALKVRHNGIESGFVGGKSKLKSNEEFNKLMHGELVINPTQMDNFITKTLPTLINRNPESTTNNMSPSLVLNVNGSLDNSVLPEVKQMMNNGIEKLTTHMKNVGFRVNAKSYGI